MDLALELSSVLQEEHRVVEDHEPEPQEPARHLLVELEQLGHVCLLRSPQERHRRPERCLTARLRAHYGPVPEDAVLEQPHLRPLALEPPRLVYVQQRELHHLQQPPDWLLRSRQVPSAKLVAASLVADLRGEFAEAVAHDLVPLELVARAWAVLHFRAWPLEPRREVQVSWLEERLEVHQTAELREPEL